MTAFALRTPELFASLTITVFAAALAISAKATPASLIVTAPEDTAKLSLEKDATPLLLVLASSPATVNRLPVRVVSTPSPPIILNSSPKLISKTFELSSPIVTKELAIFAFVTFASTIDAVTTAFAASSSAPTASSANIEFSTACEAIVTAPAFVIVTSPDSAAAVKPVPSPINI